METFNGNLYEENEWKRCWIAHLCDGGWIIGEMSLGSGLHYLINSDNSGQILVHEQYISWGK